MQQSPQITYKHIQKETEPTFAMCCKLNIHIFMINLCMKGNLNFSRINFHMKNNVAKLFDKICLQKNFLENLIRNLIKKKFLRKGLMCFHRKSYI